MNAKDIVVTDIDGCLVDYPKVFLSWVAENKNLAFNNLSDLRASMPTEEYENIKHHYRISGAKRAFSVLSDAKETLQWLKSKGLSIWVVTTRPDWEPVVSDTKHWLKASGIPYDELYFTENKKSFIANGLKDKLKFKFVIEDDSEVVDYAATALDIFTFSFARRKQFIEHRNLKEVSSWREIQAYLENNLAYIR